MYNIFVYALRICELKNIRIRYDMECSKCPSIWMFSRIFILRVFSKITAQAYSFLKIKAIIIMKQVWTPKPQCRIISSKTNGRLPTRQSATCCIPYSTEYEYFSTHICVKHRQIYYTNIILKSQLFYTTNHWTWNCEICLKSDTFCSTYMILHYE